MNETYFFDVPIYRCSKEEHTKQMERDKQKHIGIYAHMRSPAVDKRMSDDFEERKWYPWQYNEIIGWIQIYRLGGQIRGEFWKIRKRVTNVKNRFLAA